MFTASPTNGGDTPHYQWKQNGNNVGTDSVIFQTNQLNNGDVVSTVMTSSIGCASPALDTSNSISVTVNQPYITPTISITASATSVCPGTLVTFTASSTNGGVPWYSWYLNGVYVPGPNSDTFQSSTLANGDKVKCVLTSSLACVTNVTTISNEITITVGSQPPSVTINASDTSICSGQLVTFTATPTNGGTDPVYEWTVNNNAMNTVSSNIYQTTSLKDGDVVRVAMQPSGSCAGGAGAYSNSITMTVTASVVPSVTITASAIDICSGQQVTFTANPTNGGNTPSYQWKLNGADVGGDSAVFNTSTLANADTVKVVMTSSLGCASPQIVTSNYISMDVSPSVIPSVSITASATTICSGAQVTFTATPTNGGTPHYEWVVNGNEVGTNSDTYQSSTLTNGDSIYVYMTSSLPCANPKFAKSNVIVISVNSSQTFYRDLDGDGYGSSASGTINACSAPPGYVSNNNDCNDSNASVHPGATEICGNGIDDNCNGTVDEACTTTRIPVLMVRTYPVKEGDAGETPLDAIVTLDTIATTNASVHYATIDEDAKAGQDYMAKSGWLTIPAGSSSATIQLKIIGDVLTEGNEHFSIRFSQPSGVAFNGDSTSRVIIIDDDHNMKRPTSLVVPNLARRNQIWQIPGIDSFQNEVLVMDANGQVIKRFFNYRNQSSIGNIAIGFYFYRIQTKENGELKTYTGRLLVTE